MGPRRFGDDHMSSKGERGLGDKKKVQGEVCALHGTASPGLMSSAGHGTRSKTYHQRRALVLKGGNVEQQRRSACHKMDLHSVGPTDYNTN